MHGTLARTTEQQVCGRVVLLVSCWSSVASLGRHAIPGAQAEAFAVPGVPSLIIADDITSYYSDGSIRTQADASVPIKMFRLANLSLTGRPSGSFATSPAVEPILTPHGSPIPTVDGKVAAGKGVPSTQLEAGDEGTVAEVEDRDPDFLRYLSSLGDGPRPPQVLIDPPDEPVADNVFDLFRMGMHLVPT